MADVLLDFSAGEKPIDTLKEFYEFMFAVRSVKKEIVAKLTAKETLEPAYTTALKTALASLTAKTTNKTTHAASLYLDDAKTKTIDLDFFYEIEEMKKDIVYLEEGVDAVIKLMQNLHHGYDEKVSAGVKMMKGISFRNFITDRDGTISNYCGRYLTSIQSVYNSMMLQAFIKAKTENSIIITSAPLANTGIVDISIDAPGSFIYAASKGREFIDKSGVRQSFPISEVKQNKLNQLNEAVKVLMAKPENQKYNYLGSGVQFKFGQTTIARQDVNRTVPSAETDMFLKEIEKLVKTNDPTGEFFRIEDTGLDVEIILTVDSADDNGELKDFDKADGVNYLNDALNLDLTTGPTLICGDTNSDVPMVHAAMAKCSEDTYAIFSTPKSDLDQKVKKTCPNSVVVDTPDMLVSILYQLSKY